MMKTLSTGKQRGLSQLTTEDGGIGIVALDHREDTLGASLLSHRFARAEDDWEAMVAFKEVATRSFSRVATGVLLDAVRGVQECVQRGALSGRCGVMITAEDFGHVENDSGRRAELRPESNAAYFRQLGGQAVKLLVYTRLERPEALARQEAMTRALASQCEREDLLFLVEAQTYRLPGESAAEYAVARVEEHLQTCLLLESWGADILKMEFPWPLGGEDERAAALEACREVTASVSVPWAILSAGVGFDQFAQQVEVAVAGGASGFVGGRALWQEAVSLLGDTRAEWFDQVGAARISRLLDIVAAGTR